ncbi:MAG: hypothetical protein A2156_09360 [Deltaproteobacteria bacterium RBG_16_48_10]|nr:MAG: hypothetical protein A2156_09360 [Deltaproteobacteria bacterium RBG_16_48_10]
MLRRVEFRRYSKIRTEVKGLILESIAGIQNAYLLEPAMIYKIYSVTEMTSSQVSLEGNSVVDGSLLPLTFPEVKKLAIGVCTTGYLKRQAFGTRSRS